MTAGPPDCIPAGTHRAEAPAVRPEEARGTRAEAGAVGPVAAAVEGEVVAHAAERGGWTAAVAVEAGPRHEEGGAWLVNGG